MDKGKKAASRGLAHRTLMTKRRALPRVKPDKGVAYLKGFGSRARKGEARERSAGS